MSGLNGKGGPFQGRLIDKQGLVAAHMVMEYFALATPTNSLQIRTLWELQVKSWSYREFIDVKFFC